MWEACADLALRDHLLNQEVPVFSVLPDNFPILEDYVAIVLLATAVPLVAQNALNARLVRSLCPVVSVLIAAGWDKHGLIFSNNARYVLWIPFPLEVTPPVLDVQQVHMRQRRALPAGIAVESEER